MKSFIFQLIEENQIKALSGSGGRGWMALIFRCLKRRCFLSCCAFGTPEDRSAQSNSGRNCHKIQKKWAGEPGNNGCGTTFC